MKTLTIIFLFALASGAKATLPSDYQSWDGCEKRNYLINEKILPSEYTHLPPYLKGGFKALIGSGALFSLDESFNHTSDEMPKGRLKVIHTYGSVAAVEFKGKAFSPYTGLFRGACGLVRLAWAAPPLLAGHTPGMAVKLFIDGLPSANLHVMESLDGQGENTNFFERTFTNILPEPDGFILKLADKIFSRFVTRTTHLDVSHLSLHSKRGREIPFPRAPYQIYFVASDEVQMPTNSEQDLRVNLTKIPVGTVLYEVYARDEGEGEPKKIGELKTSSYFISSKYGDEKLFFQHSDTFLKEKYKD